MGAEPVGLDLEGGAGVVVQAPDEHVVHGKGRFQNAQILLKGPEMILTILADELENRRGLGDHFPAPLHLAIKNPEGIGHRPAATVRAKGGRPFRQKAFQFLPERASALGAAERVDLE